MRVVRKALLVLVAAAAASAAGASPQADPDRLFEQARELGFAGQRAEARALCVRILETSPGYDDVRIFLGRLWAWDREYGPARDELLRVLERRPDLLDAWRALIDVELWADRPGAALGYCDEALGAHPAEPDLLFRKARALNALGRRREALSPAREAARLRPESPEMARLVRRLRYDDPRHKISSVFTYESFNDSTAPWRDVYFQYNRKVRGTTVIGRVRHAHRFRRSDQQYEIDAYPKLGRKHYLYLNAGYSPGRVFPEWRYGAELYRKLPRKFEASLGFRRLEFDTSDVTLFTGSLGRYIGNYFVWVRPYFSDKDIGTSLSGQWFVRRYSSDPETYITLMVGAGSSPDVDEITGQDLSRLDSSTLRLDWQKRLSDRWILKGRAGFRSEEFENNRERDSWELGIGFERFF